MKINDVTWGIFEVKDLFEVHERGKRLTQNDREDGIIPLVTAGENNNGIDDFINNPEQKTYYNALTIDMFGNVFYQPNMFKCDDNITVIQHEKLNRYTAKFLLTSFKHLTNKYSYAYQLRPNRIGQDILNLPITDDNQPDWGYMEKYIKEKEDESNNRIVIFLKNELNKLGSFDEKTLADVYEWKEYKINDIADVYSGNDWTYKDRVKGDAPFIGASSINNSITDFVDPHIKPKYVQKNAISINRNGSIGYSFYHPYVAYFSGDTRFIKLKNNIDSNEYISLFITTVIEKQRHKYMYGYKMGTDRIKNQYIMLPAQVDGRPDYDFMNDYMRTIKHQRIQKLLKFLSEGRNT